ncbi:CDP-glucose 4,6-dehydratase [Butyrivibrio sp. JL13D10]|uniref:CDP-glucose 4,6-dehydratase n=1 Tax=Butyrivibrio sp. JL13D10 TaxID=3236815 RepID=UPI0038B510BB
MQFEELRNFYDKRRVFVTGHTGFKGSWLCFVLKMLGADVYGYGLAPNTDPGLFNILELESKLNHTLGDIRDFDELNRAFTKADPEVVFHLAAQPIVRESYRDPRYTYETNVMGTVNILECVRNSRSVRSFLNVTTDKVYENNELRDHAFSEDEKLDGYDPYSNSKSCSELVTHSYMKSFFKSKENGKYDAAMHNDSSRPFISTARAGNVIGGGDFAKDRIIPDCVRGVIAGEDILVRNPGSVRPYQHVLEPIFVYLMIAMKQAQDLGFAGSYNVGPELSDCMTTGELADEFVRCWGDDAGWRDISENNAPHEASFLRLDCAKLKKTFGWKPIWNAREAVSQTVNWYKAWHEGVDMEEFTERQVQEYSFLFFSQKNRKRTL